MSSHQDQSIHPGDAEEGSGRRTALDPVDTAIVETLVADGRLSMTALAEAVSISRANAYERVRRLEHDGVIRGYGARVDPGALGRSLAALVLVSVDQRQWKALKGELAELPGLVYQASATGPFDHLLLVRVPDVETLRDVVLDRLHAIPAVRSTQTVFLLEEHGELTAALRPR